MVYPRFGVQLGTILFHSVKISTGTSSGGGRSLYVYAIWTFGLFC